MKIRKLSEGVNVAPLYWALQSHPELWDLHDGRTRDPGSPHHGLSDIWCRFAAPGFTGAEPHESVWYPCADVLPVREHVYPLMAAVNGERLGGVLITRIPPGNEVKPHVDPGWHARYYEKFAIQIASAPGQLFQFEGESLETKPGDVYTFDNSHLHWVTNPTEYERITMVVCIRRAESCRSQ